ncbi:MAG: hypothetical protein JWO03_2943 [Bacteroidetes bacterium]|nr:hypothetical protein [Bacteroidota bacterium]
MTFFAPIEAWEDIISFTDTISCLYESKYADAR